MQDHKELVVAPGADIFVGAAAATIPDDPVAELKGFVELGFITEDGAEFSRDLTIKEYFAAQRRNAVRREVEKEDLGANFTLEQFNADNFVFAFGGGEVVEVKSGIYKFEFPTGDDALEERSLVLRWVDGDRHYQLGFENGNVVDGVKVPLKRSDLSVLNIGYKALAGESNDSIGVSFVTDDVAFEPTGS
jgi:hypothetical protein